MDGYRQRNRAVDRDALIDSVRRLKDGLTARGVRDVRKLDELISQAEYAFSGLSHEASRVILGQTARELVEFHQLETIAPFAFEECLADAIPGTWKNILRDNSDPLNSTEQRTAGPRNRQYELWLCALLREHGIEAAWRNQEDLPDVVFDYATTRFFVEAKRPGKLSTIDSNILDASNKLSDVMKRFQDDVVFGLVAISLDLALIEKHLRQSSPPEFEVDGTPKLMFHALTGPEKVLKKPFDDLVTEVKGMDPLRHLRSRKKHLGIIFSGAYPAIEKREGKDDKLTIVSQVEVFSHEDERRILLKALSDTLRAGLEARH